MKQINKRIKRKNYSKKNKKISKRKRHRNKQKTRRKITNKLRKLYGGELETITQNFDVGELITGKNVLEVGSGTGQLSYNLIHNNLTKYAEEPDKQLRKYIVTEYSEDDTKFLNIRYTDERISYISGVDATKLSEHIGEEHKGTIDIALSFYPWFYGIGEKPVRDFPPRLTYNEYTFNSKMLNSIYEYLTDSGKMYIFGATLLPYNYCETDNEVSETPNDCNKYKINPRGHNPWLLLNASKFYDKLFGYNLTIYYQNPGKIKNQYLLTTTTSKPDSTRSSKIKTFNTVYEFTKLADITQKGTVSIKYYE
jgi:hypothetical protein